MSISLSSLHPDTPHSRLSLTSNDTTDVAVVTIAVPELDVAAVTHRYTCHEPQPNDRGLYRYESGDESVELSVDGVVIDDPDRFERVTP